MKKFYFIFLAIGITACSVDPVNSIDSESMETANVSAKNNNNNGNSGSLDEGNFIVPEQICAGQEAEFSIEADVPTNLQVQQFDEISGEWLQVYQKGQSETNPETFLLTFEEAGEYWLRYKIGGGKKTEITVQVENCSCEESFSYSQNQDGSYTFTYIPEENLDDALLIFTFAQGFAEGLSDNWTYVQNGKGNAQTWETTMDLTACTEYNWNVTLTANCDGNTEKNNVWTDFKVNDESKKGELDNIVHPCN